MRTVSVRTVLFGLAASTAALLLSACGSDAEGTIVIYTGRHYDLETAFSAFENEFNIDIEFLEGSDAELRERIAAEGEHLRRHLHDRRCRKPPTAAEAGIFFPIDSAVLAVPAELRDPDGNWFALSARARTIVYSTERLSPDEIPPPTRNSPPEWKGRLRNSSNTYTQSSPA